LNRGRPRAFQLQLRDLSLFDRWHSNVLGPESLQIPPSATSTAKTAGSRVSRDELKGKIARERRRGEDDALVSSLMKALVG
jgi:hypothetical protein